MGTDRQSLLPAHGNASPPSQGRAGGFCSGNIPPGAASNVTAKCCGRYACPGGAAQLPTESPSPAPLQPCPAHTHPPGAAPGKKLPFPVPIGKEKEGTTPSFALLLSSTGCLPRKGRDALFTEQLAWCCHYGSECKGTHSRWG